MNTTILKWYAVLLVSVAGMPIATNARVMDGLNQLEDNTHHWFVGADVGLMRTLMSQEAMTVPNGSDYPPPGNVDQYSLNQPQSTMLDIQVGHRWNRDKQWLPSYAFSLRYEHIFTKTIAGMVTQYSDPDFTNYSYTWGG